MELKASRANKNAISECLKRNSDILKELSAWCLEELPSKLVRTKYEVLITIQVHQRDVLADLVVVNFLNICLKFRRDFLTSVVCNLGTLIRRAF